MVRERRSHGPGSPPRGARGLRRPRRPCSGGKDGTPAAGAKRPGSGRGGGLAILAILGLFLASTAAAQTTLRIGLREDPDVLDPTLARTYVGRIVFASLCDKLFDIDEKLQIVPQLATGHAWSADNRTLTIKLRDDVLFHDGEKLDAEAVKLSLDRHLTLQGSFRRSEINVVQAVEVVDPLTVKLSLSVPFAPLIAQLTDRAGMIMSPKALKEAGAQFGTKPVCAGPFRFGERIAQDRIVLERFDRYWDKAAIHVDRVVFQPIQDTTVLLANLQAGQLDLIERVNPTDAPAIKRDRRLRLVGGEELGYTGLTLNVGNGERAKTPLGQDARVREALELAIDREAVNQVVYGGEFTVSSQWVPPGSPFHLKDLPAPTRDVARARKLLAEAGVPAPVVNLMIPNNPDLRQAGEVIQAMAKEAGFDIRLQATEFASALQAAARGEFEAFLVGWSGRSDPDGNIYSFASCKGGQNDGRYCNAEVDRLLDAARATPDTAERIKLYRQVAELYLIKERGRIYLWHRKNLFAHTTRLQGLRLVPDGLIRVHGLRFGG
ncbi:MAG: ABC transporter substrate-binding protein [Alphaproteobacteria bacterium]|nr:ABC transporter substrate-binding protein [Alphaproteobacteria bacterium]